MSQPMSFIQNINYLARNIHLLERGEELLTPAAVRALTKALDAPLGTIVEDIKKGVSDRGNRKLDISTADNYTRDPSSVEYSAISITGSDPSFVVRHEFVPSHKPRDILNAVRGAIEAYNVAAEAQETTLISDYDTKLELSTCEEGGHGWLVRITDATDDDSLLSWTQLTNIKLHVAENSLTSAVAPSVDYYWYKTTSSFLLSTSAVELLSQAVRRTTQQAHEALMSAQASAQSAAESEASRQAAETAASEAEQSAQAARGVVAVDSIADLLALPEGQRKEGLRYLVKGYHAGSDVGGGEFYWDQSRPSENNGGTVIDGFVRIGHSVTIESFGCVGDGATDNGDKIEKLNEFLVDSPIKVTAGKGVFVTSVPFEPTTGFSGSGMDETFIKWIGNGINAAGVVILSGPGTYCDFTADGGVSDDPIAWDASNYDSFTGVRGVRIASDFVNLINVRGQNTRMAGIASYGFKNTRLENCEAVRTRGNFGDGFYFTSVKQVTFVNCKAYDFTRIGFVAEGKVESPSIGVDYENCVAEYGHDLSILYGGGEYNAGFWNENSTLVSHISCKTINSGSRGYATAFGAGSNFLKACGAVTYTSCTAINGEDNLGTSMTDTGFSLNALDSPYGGRVILINCSTIMIDRGYDSGSGVDSILLGCSYTNSGGTDQARTISAASNASIVIKNFQELWSNRPSYITDGATNVASIGSFSGGGATSARLISVDGYTTLDGAPCVVKNRIESSATALRLEIKNTSVSLVGIVHTRGGFVLEGGSLTILPGTAGVIIEPLEFIVAGAHVELEGSLRVNWNDSTRRISMSNCSISKKGSIWIELYRIGGEHNINPRAIFNDCTFRWNLEEDGYIASQNGVLPYRHSAGQSHLYSNCTFVNTGGSTDKTPIQIESTSLAAGVMYFTGCWKSPTIGDMTKAGFTKAGSVIEDL